MIDLGSELAGYGEERETPRDSIIPTPSDKPMKSTSLADLQKQGFCTTPPPPCTYRKPDIVITETFGHDSVY